MAENSKIIEGLEAALAGNYRIISVDPSRPWQPIETAPKDGTVIELTALEDNGQPFEIWPMQWMAIQRNGLFPCVVGMWTAPDGSHTWNEHPTLGGGPTHWRPATSKGEG